MADSRELTDQTLRTRLAPRAHMIWLFRGETWKKIEDLVWLVVEKEWSLDR